MVSLHKPIQVIMPKIGEVSNIFDGPTKNLAKIRPTLFCGSSSL